MKNKPVDPAAEELRRLSGVSRAAYAMGLLTTRTRRDTLRAALGVLQQTPLPEARPALRALYDHSARAGGAHDFGAYVRSDLLRALRPLVTGEDGPMLVAAASTYEFPPPAFKEETALLRSTALVVLAGFDETEARFHAARLLVDQYTDPMSGEPALTAAQTLAAYGDMLSLFQYVMDDRHPQPPEVVAECLRGMTRLPQTLVGTVLARVANKSPSVVLVGLVDFLLRHERGPLESAWLLNALKSAPLDAYRYALFAIVAAGDDDLLTQTVVTLRGERDPHRIAAAADALGLAATRPDIAALLESPPFAPRPGAKSPRPRPSQ